MDGREVLERVREGRAVNFGDQVVVIGDGITAVDVARTALRLGAKHVRVIAEHDADNLPAGARDLCRAREEGVKFEFEAVAKHVDSASGVAQGVECARIRRDGNVLSEIPGTEFAVTGATVVMAARLCGGAR